MAFETALFRDLGLAIRESSSVERSHTTPPPIHHTPAYITPARARTRSRVHARKPDARARILTLAH